MPTVDFATLWAAHPALQTPSVIAPCTTQHVENYSNQCAIRMGVCLVQAGVSLATFRGACCWHGHGRQHVLRAEELMKWLNTRDASFVGSAVISKRSKRGVQKSASDFAGKSGIVVCRNFWGTGNQGDHIDLWDGETLAHGAADYFNKSQEIWFWSLS